MTSHLPGLAFWVAVSSGFWCSSTDADIQFEEVTKEAGILHRGATYGASWGDFNEDGYPDIWVNNHYRKPSLYMNHGDGTFKDVIDEVLSGDLHGDAHGAAWADFDNDGDQDLVELAGAQYGVGEGASRLYVNNGGRLHDQAQSLELQQPLGRGRSPMWLDANRDGQLDLVYMNGSRPDGKAPSTLFLQTDSVFVDAGELLGFKDPKRSRADKIRDMYSAAMRLRFGVPPIIYGHARFAQLAELTDDNSLELLIFGPLRIYEITGSRFRDITYDFDFNRITGIRDAAVSDFDGDGDMDIYLVRAHPRSQAFNLDARTLRASMLGKSGSESLQVLTFESGSNLEFYITAAKLEPANILIGGERRPAEGLEFVLESTDAMSNLTESTEVQSGNVTIEYIDETSQWRIVVADLDAFLEIRGNQRISIVEVPAQSKEHPRSNDVLLLRDGRRLVPKVAYEGTDEMTDCHSIVAEDLDNDGDSDIYLVCTGSAINSQNVLLENSGRGQFSVVPDAGGAGGSHAGRGDAVTSGDYDGDGYIDLFITNGVGDRVFVTEGPHQLFRNKGGENNWLQLELRGVRSNRDGIGTHVVLESGGKRQIRDQGGGMHNNAQDFDRIHFGLGKAEVAERIEIHWPSGTVQTIKEVPANRVIVVREQ